ncbi:MAG: hypothetical protein H6621_11095 [Halobacteriovoraceae bacterium]|nr:hypothetical protein [Halobacteriovoraceae bacterium]MCB9095604.1 hypothetical protein [Halobacteriovoraceae bacterium]
MKTLFIFVFILSSPWTEGCAKFFGRNYEKMRQIIRSEFSHIIYTKGNRPIDYPYRVGEFVNVDNKRYQVVELLGSGSEAFVLLLKDSESEKRVVMKYFRNNDDASFAVSGLGEYKNIPGIHIVNFIYLSGNIGLYEHVEGIPVRYIKTLYKELGLSIEEKDGIIQKFKDMNKLLDQSTDVDRNGKKPWFSLVLEGNVIYNFEQDRLIIIDPH